MLACPIKKMKKEKGGTRSQVSRLNRIVILLKRSPGRKATKRQLADFLGMSERTVQRDIQALIVDHGYEIEIHDWQEGGYFLKDPIAPLILMDVSAREVVSVLMASRCLEDYAGTPFETPLRTAFLKLSGLMKGLVKVSSEKWEEVVQVQQQKKELCGPELFETLANAISSKMAINFYYLKPGQQIWRQRRVEPYLLFYTLGIWYVVSYDLEARGWRKFALARMKDAEIVEQVSTHGSTSAARKLADRGMGAFFSGKPETIRLWLDAKAAWFAGRSPWHPTQKLENRSDGTAEMTLEVSGTQDIIRKIMEWCPDVIVLSPLALRQEVEEKLRIGQTRHKAGAFESVSSSKPITGRRTAGGRQGGNQPVKRDDGTQLLKLNLQPVVGRGEEGNRTR